MSLKSDCKCGHDVDTHYKDLITGKRITCLASRCDCKRFVDARTPSSPPTPRTPDYSTYQGWSPPKRRPHQDTSCTCDGCRAYEEALLESLRPPSGWPYVGSIVFFPAYDDQGASVTGAGVVESLIARHSARVRIMKPVQYADKVMSIFVVNLSRTP